MNSNNTSGLSGIRNIGARCSRTGITLGILLFSQQLVAASLAISDSPLFLSSGVRPNVFFELDDSGSMDWEVLTKKHWSYCEYEPNAPTDIYNFAFDTCDTSMRDNGLWQSYSGSSTVNYEYVYNNSDASYSIGCSGNSRQAMYQCNSSLSSNTPYSWDWRILSSDFNVLYYDNDESYKPWLGPCDSSGTACGNASFTSARSNPRNGSAGYSVTRNLTGFAWEEWVDDRGYTGSRPYRGNEVNATSTPNKVVDLWDAHVRYQINSSNIKVRTTTYTPSAGGLNPSSTTKTLSGSGCFTELGGNGVSCRTIAQVRQNVANWYQYARKRQFVAKAGISAVMDFAPGFRYGLDTINQTSSFVEVPTGLGNFAPHNDSLLDELFGFSWPARGTPLRSGLKRAGNYFADNLSGKTDPIEYSCQKNFTILMTDGYWNGSNPGIGDRDGDSVDDSVADVARYYYDHDLDTGMANDVEPDQFDPATYQHMVTFTLAFGVEGQLVDGNDAAPTPPVFGEGPGWPFPLLTESSDWGDPTSCSSCAEQIDDLWHAAYNGRGTFIAASTPQSVVAGLKSAIQNVSSRTGAASSVALSSGVINSTTSATIYQARFIDSDWHGELLSIPFSSGGVIDLNNIVDAGTGLTTQATSGTRAIMTHDDSQGVLFDWTGSGTSLSVAQQALLNTDANGTTDSLGQARVGWLRGDSSQEVRNGGSFRNRNNGVLGDIINSAPVFVAGPDGRYPSIWAGGNSAPENCNSCQTYAAFKTANASRTPMVYVGANDGMLHGFDANFSATAVEKLAYVPSSVIGKLSQLTDPAYNHNYYVDGSPTVIDAFFSSQVTGGDDHWHTVLVGGLNKGGQGIYALDITDPTSFAATSASAQGTVLWEFTDADDPDLGFSFSRPAVVRLANGRWGAVFGNGYNNRDQDGNRSSTGHAVLFIVDIQTGALIKKIDTTVGSGSTPNGLATPTVVDTNGDFIADYVYAGDLKGNMWKFSINDPDPLNWDISFYNASNVPKPFYIAKDSAGNRQPITVRAEVGRGPGGVNSMVYFGTGIYLQSADITDTSAQTFYGLLDKGTKFTGRSNTVLAPQTVDFEGTTNDGFPFRITSANPVGTRGWLMDLPTAGERSVGNPILRAGRIIFVSVIPDPNVCNSGGFSWLMELNALTGKRLNESPFDVNNDGVFSLLDYQAEVDINNDGIIDSKDRTPVSGKGFNSLIPMPGILTDVNADFKITSTSAGGLDATAESKGKFIKGRQSWNLLR